MKKRKTLEARLRETGLVPATCDRAELEKLLLEKRILVSGVPATSLARLVSDGEAVSLYQEKAYVGRGALKLSGALDAFRLSPKDCVAADVGSSTGGFTQILLERGAKKVYAIDVGYGELAWQVRSDNRVVVMERTNARELESLPEPISFVSMDLSFISVLKVMSAVKKWVSAEANLVVLIKPQFEADRDDVPDGGVMTDTVLIAQIVANTIAKIESVGFVCKNKSPSVITGGDGNQEWFVWLQPA